MSQEWNDTPSAESGSGARRQRWASGGNAGQRAPSGSRTRGQAAPATGQSSSSRAGRSPSDQIWQSRLQEMSREAEQNLSDGALTAGYMADSSEVIALLKRAQAGEWTSFLQYWHHYFMASDIHGKEVQKVFKAHAKDELDHARMMGERIQQLGGVPCDSPEEIQRLTPTPVEYGHDLRGMMEADLIGERQTIDFYDEIIRACGFDDNVTRAMFEDINEEENDHADDFATLLFAFDGSSGHVIESTPEDVHQIAKTSAPEKGPGQVRRTA